MAWHNMTHAPVRACRSWRGVALRSCARTCAGSLPSLATTTSCHPLGTRCGTPPPASARMQLYCTSSGHPHGRTCVCVRGMLQEGRCWHHELRASSSCASSSCIMLPPPCVHVLRCADSEPLRCNDTRGRRQPCEPCMHARPGRRPAGMHPDLPAWHKRRKTPPSARSPGACMHACSARCRMCMSMHAWEHPERL